VKKKRSHPAGAKKPNSGKSLIFNETSRGSREGVGAEGNEKGKQKGGEATRIADGRRKGRDGFPGYSRKTFRKHLKRHKF